MATKHFSTGITARKRWDRYIQRANILTRAKKSSCSQNSILYSVGRTKMTFGTFNLTRILHIKTIQNERIVLTVENVYFLEEGLIRDIYRK